MKSSHAVYAAVVFGASLLSGCTSTPAEVPDDLCQFIGDETIARLVVDPETLDTSRYATKTVKSATCNVRTLGEAKVGAARGYLNVSVARTSEAGLAEGRMRCQTDGSPVWNPAGVGDRNCGTATDLPGGNEAIAILEAVRGSDYVRVEYRRIPGAVTEIQDAAASLAQDILKRL